MMSTLFELLAGTCDEDTFLAMTQDLFAEEIESDITYCQRFFNPIVPFTKTA